MICSFLLSFSQIGLCSKMGGICEALKKQVAIGCPLPTISSDNIITKPSKFTRLAFSPLLGWRRHKLS